MEGQPGVESVNCCARACVPDFLFLDCPGRALDLGSIHHQCELFLQKSVYQTDECFRRWVEIRTLHGFTSFSVRKLKLSLGSSVFNSPDMLVNGQLGYLPTTGILNIVIFILWYLLFRCP